MSLGGKCVDNAISSVSAANESDEIPMGMQRMTELLDYPSLQPIEIKQ